MTAPAVPGAIGLPLARIEAREKVTGQARYAYEHSPENVGYCVPVQATVASGEVRSVEGPGTVLWAGNAPELAEVPDGELAVLQSRRVSYRGQIVAAVVADTLEEARAAAGLVRVEYDEAPHDVVLRPDHPDIYTPEKVNPSFPSESSKGDFESAYAAAPHTIDATYTTPAFHNNPMEPHASVAVWEADGSLTVHDSTQHSSGAAQTLAKVFALEPEIVVIGSGTHQRFPSSELMGAILSRGIGCEVMDTGAACRTYNILASEDRRVVAALLLRD